MTVIDARAAAANDPDAANEEIFHPGPERWVVRRKAVIVAAVRDGTLSLQEACRRYHLSVEEFLAWQRAIDAHGVPGLRVTRLQIYRDTDARRAR
jgi:hypothetical protein